MNTSALQLRRRFLFAILIVALGETVFFSLGRGEGVSPPAVFRTVTYNVLQCSGFPKEGREAGAALEEIAAALEPLQADLISFQECPPEPFMAQLAARLKMHHVFFPGHSSRFPGAILSRYPILESQDIPALRPPEEIKKLFTRHWGRAVIGTPFGKLVVHSAHLYYKQDAAGAARRKKEIEVLGEVIARDAAQNLPVLLQGDLNNTPTTEEHRQLENLGLTDVFQQCGGEPSKSYSALQPAIRIDYVFSGGAWRQAAQSCRILDEEPFRANDRSRSLSDHLPLIAELLPPPVRP